MTDTVLRFTFSTLHSFITAQKTNNVNKLPPQQMMAGGWVSQTGLGEVGENSSSWRNENSALQLQLRTPTVNPVQTTVVQTTVEDIARGWRVESVAINENHSYEMEGMADSRWLGCKPNIAGTIRCPSDNAKVYIVLRRNVHDQKVRL